MKWLRWRSNHASHSSPWHWEPIGDDATEEDARDRAYELNDRMGYERSPTYSIVDVAPPWAVEYLIKDVELRVRSLQAHLKQLKAAPTRPCDQCDTAVAWPSGKSEFTRKGEPAPTEHRALCPHCGREVVEETLTPGLLRADEKKALALLRKLIKGAIKGPASDRTLFRWPVDEKAYGRLSDLGLAYGSIQRNTASVSVTDRGRREATRHKARTK